MVHGMSQLCEDPAHDPADLRLISLAAQAFLSWRDTGDFPQLLDDSINGDELARALDRLAGVA